MLFSSVSVLIECAFLLLKKQFKGCERGLQQLSASQLPPASASACLPLFNTVRRSDWPSNQHERNEAWVYRL